MFLWHHPVLDATGMCYEQYRGVLCRQWLSDFLTHGSLDKLALVPCYFWGGAGGRGKRGGKPASGVFQFFFLKIIGMKPINVLYTQDKCF